MPEENDFENYKKRTLKGLMNAALVVLELLKVAALAGICILAIRYFLFKPFYVKGASMEPNFYEKEYLIIDELSYRFRAPERGEVVVFRYPDNPKEYFLKRLISLPGETIKISGGKVIIYNQDNPEGWELQEFYLPDDLATQGERIITNGDSQYFVMGDNRDNSFDSRRFGPIDSSLIVGRAWFRGWPFSRVSTIDTPEF